MINIRSFKNITFRGCSVRSASNLYIDNFIQSCEVRIYNTILDVPHIVTNSTIYNKVINVVADNVVLITTVADFIAIQSGYQTVTFNYSSIQESWSSYLATADPSDYTTINYLSDNFRNITLSGSEDYDSNFEDWYEGLRDGVGALYFEAPATTLSSDTYEEYPPFTASIGLSGTSANDYLQDLTYYVADLTSATDALTISYRFTRPGKYFPRITAKSYNGWNDIDSTSLGISALDSSISAVFDILLKSTSADVDSAYIYQNLCLSGSYSGQDGLFSKYTVDLNDGRTATIYDSTFIYDFQYEDIGSYNIGLELTNVIGQTFSATSTIDITGGTSANYYVNISSNYDIESSGAPHTGTTGSALTFAEFLTYLETSGSYFDNYRLKGARFIERDSTQEPWKPFVIDTDKKFVIRDWDNLSYGPWVLAVTDYAEDENSILDFSNCILKNGVIYNIPYENNSTYYGGQYYFTHLYSMYVVSQGSGSFIKLVDDTDTSACDLYGNTLYSENGYKDGNNEYRLNLYDSVLENFDNIDDNFRNAAIYNYNNCFTNSAIELDTYFTVSGTSGCQYNWESPDDYPFKRDCVFYEESMDWIVLNKKKLQPFDAISATPNPGWGSTTYPGYDEGLFGYQRKAYDRE